MGLEWIFGRQAAGGGGGGFAVHSPRRGQGPMAGSGEHSDEPPSPGTIELVHNCVLLM
jgi:hypothetical protein